MPAKQGGILAYPNNNSQKGYKAPRLKGGGNINCPNGYMKNEEGECVPIFPYSNAAGNFSMRQQNPQYPAGDLRIPIMKRRPPVLPKMFIEPTLEHIHPNSMVEGVNYGFNLGRNFGNFNLNAGVNSSLINTPNGTFLEKPRFNAGVGYRYRFNHGGDISLPNVYPNQYVQRFDEGGPAGCPEGFVWNEQRQTCTTPDGRTLEELKADNDDLLKKIVMTGGLGYGAAKYGPKTARFLNNQLMDITGVDLSRTPELFAKADPIKGQSPVVIKDAETGKLKLNTQHPMYVTGKDAFESLTAYGKSKLTGVKNEKADKLKENLKNFGFNTLLTSANRLSPVFGKTLFYKLPAEWIMEQSLGLAALNKNAVGRGVSQGFKNLVTGQPFVGDYAGLSSSFEAPNTPFKYDYGNLVRQYLHGNQGSNIIGAPKYSELVKTDLPIVNLSEYAYPGKKLQHFEMPFYSPEFVSHFQANAPAKYIENFQKLLGQDALAPYKTYLKDPNTGEEIKDELFLDNRATLDKFLKAKIIEANLAGQPYYSINSNYKDAQVFFPGMEYVPHDIGGHRQHFYLDDAGNVQVMLQDIWKYTPKDYNTRYNIEAGADNDLDAKFKLSGANLLSNAGYPFVTSKVIPLRLNEDLSKIVKEYGDWSAVKQQYGFPANSTSPLVPSSGTDVITLSVSDGPSTTPDKPVAEKINTTGVSKRPTQKPKKGKTLLPNQTKNVNKNSFAQRVKDAGGIKIQGVDVNSGTNLSTGVTNQDVKNIDVNKIKSDVETRDVKIGDMKVDLNDAGKVEVKRIKKIGLKYGGEAYNINDILDVPDENLNAFISKLKKQGYTFKII